MNRILGTVVSLVAAAALAGCGAASSASSEKAGVAGSGETGEKLKVYTTLYSLEYVTKRIGSDHIEVVNMVPAGVEAHDFEPTARDMVDLAKADLFIYNGNGLELWVEKAVSNLASHHTQVLNATEGLHLENEKNHDTAGGQDAAENGEKQAAGHAAHGDAQPGEETAGVSGDGHEHGHSHGGDDPHVWLDPMLLKAQAEAIRDALAAKDPAHAAAYEENFQKLAADLDQLDREFQEMVGQAAKREFMVSHSAFGYLANRYGLKQIAISGVDPSDEPSPSEMKKLVERVRERGISYVLLEPLASAEMAEVIAREAGVKTATLNPLEAMTEEDLQAGKDYMSIMRENLEALRLALNE